MNEPIAAPLAFETLRQSIRDDDAVEITRVALCVARDRAAEFTEARLSEDWGNLESRVLRRFGEPLDGLGVDLSDSARSELLRVSDEGLTHPLAVDCDPARAREALVAQSLAWVLEEHFGSRFFGHLAAHGARGLGSDDLLVYVSPFSKGSPFFRAYRGSLAPRPANMTSEAAGRLRTRGRLAPSMPHAAHLFWDPTWTVLDGLEPDSVAAVVVPSAEALTYDLDEERMRFSAAGPKDADRAREVALQLVQRADQAGASLVVLPEVCLDPAGASALADWIEREAAHIVLAVCGSHHRRTEEGWDNVAIIAHQGGRPEARLEQPKVRPFTLRKGDPKREYVEDIERAGRRLTLLSGRSMSVLPVICFDFLDKDLRRACEDLQPALVLVSACSETTGVFEADAQAFAMSGQAHVVLANQGVGEPDVAMAVIARPHRSSPQCLEAHRPAGDPAPGAWATSLALQGGPWQPIPADT